MTVRRPVAFDIAGDDAAVSSADRRSSETLGKTGRIVFEDDFQDEAGLASAPPRERKRFSWLRLFLGAAFGLVSLAIGLAVDDLVRALFARQDWLGWLAIGLLGLAGLALLAMVVREIGGLMWIARVDRLRREAETAVLKDDDAVAERVVAALDGLYARRGDLASGRARTADHADQIIDGRDRLKLAEAELMAPLDETAARLVSDAAKRVSVVTAVSPRAFVDVAFVLVATLALIRRLAALYGGRPGFLGLMRLTRMVVAHLAVTGSIAIGDGLAQQLIGHGLAAKLSTRLGEGVVNGMLTARVGLAAIDVCRPLPFIERARPGVSEVMGAVLGRGGASGGDAG